MAETEQSQPNSAEKISSTSVGVWPPTNSTRDAVRSRIIETLSSPSILSKRYGTVPNDEAIEAAKIIEKEAFQVAGKEVPTDEDGIEILQVYSKEISNRMLETLKARSGDSAPDTDERHKAAEEEDGGSTAPPQSEQTESVAGDD